MSEVFLLPVFSPTRMVRAIDMPNGIIKAILVHVRAICWAARASLLIQPIMMPLMTNAPTSVSVCNPAGTPNFIRDFISFGSSFKSQRYGVHSVRLASVMNQITMMRTKRLLDMRVAYPAPSKPRAGAPRLP